MRRKTHIVLIDGEGMARDGLCALLADEPGVLLTRVFSHPREALRSRLTPAPQVVIADWALALKHGPQTLRYLKLHWPHSRVLVLSGRCDARSVEAARRAGACGYLLRNDRRSELSRALHALLEGRRFVSAAVADAPPQRAAGNRAELRLLSAREQEIVGLIAEGYRTREMAQMLTLSEKTIERHRTNLMRKLGVRSATGVVAYALTHGYLGL
ncbi:MAG: response regulator transcription factor [Proteobacteria bacterium]|nr:response regulator transcription factor [Pseudomonadota bacterium]